MFDFREALLSFGSDREYIENLLRKNDIELEKDLDYTLIAEYQGQIVGTGSYSKNVLKCIAIDENFQGYGLSNMIVDKLLQKLREDGIYHVFIFTKPKYENQMQNYGFKTLEKVDNSLVLLDSDTSKLDEYLKKIKKIIAQKKYDTSNVSAIVMNANPFTRGHEYLGRVASSSSSLVLVFVVEEDRSSFSFKTRFEAVKKGFEVFENILVVEGGEYIISSATFPTYFLKDEKIIQEVYAKLDAQIFARHIAKELGIKTRYMGEEKQDVVTNNYLMHTKDILEREGIKLEVIERLKNEDGVTISASTFRKGNFLKEEDMLKFLPKTTVDLIQKEYLEKLQSKILLAKEKRLELQKLFDKKYKKILLALALNVPGHIKSRVEFNNLFDVALHDLKTFMKNANYTLLEERVQRSEVDNYYLVAINSENARAIKFDMIKFEQENTYGRLIDVDVFDKDLRLISRKDLGLKGRKCYLCEDDAINCIKSKKHDYQDLYAYFLKIAKEVK